ncbi:MAG: ABC transporter permease [Actinobacteria bacterium]|nr:ABC transporter permease [Actinomycetota bacterium]
MPIGYFGRRILIFLLVVWAAASVNFIIPRMARGDPIQAQFAQLEALGIRSEGMDKVVAAYRAKLGLDRPLWQQYLAYLQNSVTFNFGPSITYFPADVGVQIAQRIPWTLGLLTVAIVLSFLVGNLLGALLGWPRSSRFVRWLVPILMPLSAIPYYLLGLILIFLFAFTIRAFPLGEAYTTGLTIQLSWEFVASVIYHAILPALSIVLASIGFWMLGMRGMMVTNMGEDYMILAEAKGLSQRRVFLHYAMRNAMLPQFTGLALTFGSIVSGAVLVEVIFSYPGMGWILWNAIRNTDYFLIQGIVFVLVLSVALAMLLVDLSYPLIDRRIAYGRMK